jgi:hypothetical protein
VDQLSTLYTKANEIAQKCVRDGQPYQAGEVARPGHCGYYPPPAASATNPELEKNTDSEVAEERCRASGGRRLGAGASCSSQKQAAPVLGSANMAFALVGLSVTVIVLLAIAFFIRQAARQFIKDVNGEPKDGEARKGSGNQLFDIFSRSNTELPPTSKNQPMSVPAESLQVTNPTTSKTSTSI